MYRFPNIWSCKRIINFSVAPNRCGNFEDLVYDTDHCTSPNCPDCKANKRRNIMCYAKWVGEEKHEF